MVSESFELFDEDSPRNAVHLQLVGSMRFDDHDRWPKCVMIGVGVRDLLPNLTVGQLEYGFAIPALELSLDCRFDQVWPVARWRKFRDRLGQLFLRFAQRRFGVLRHDGNWLIAHRRSTICATRGRYFRFRLWC